MPVCLCVCVYIENIHVCICAYKYADINSLKISYALMYNKIFYTNMYIYKGVMRKILINTMKIIF